MYFVVFVLCLLNTPPRSYITFRNFRIRKKKNYTPTFSGILTRKNKEV